MRILNINHLYNLILACVDMKINNISVVSQSTRENIFFNERMLKYNPNGFTPVHNNEIMFDPLNNFKQAQLLFTIFLKFQEEDEGLYIKMFYEEKNAEEKTRVFVRGEQENYASQYYYNISLGYIELILALSGIMVENLFEFDAPPITEEQNKRRRTLFPQRDLF